jgi:hypothetical protein
MMVKSFIGQRRDRLLWATASVTCPGLTYWVKWDTLNRQMGERYVSANVGFHSSGEDRPSQLEMRNCCELKIVNDVSGSFASAIQEEAFESISDSTKGPEFTAEIQISRHSRHNANIISFIPSLPSFFHLKG